MNVLLENLIVISSPCLWTWRSQMVFCKLETVFSFGGWALVVFSSNGRDIHREGISVMDMASSLWWLQYNCLFRNSLSDQSIACLLASIYITFLFCSLIAYTQCHLNSKWRILGINKIKTNNLWIFLLIYIYYLYLYLLHFLSVVRFLSAIRQWYRNTTIHTDKLYEFS